MRTWEAAPGILRSRNTFGAGALLLHAALEPLGRDLTRSHLRTSPLGF